MSCYLCRLRLPVFFDARGRYHEPHGKRSPCPSGEPRQAMVPGTERRVVAVQRRGAQLDMFPPAVVPVRRGFDDA